MIDALVQLTGKQAYKYRAFELVVTLDLEVYKAIRRIIVSENMPFNEFHRVLQFLFKWENRHLHDFTVYDGDRPISRLVPFVEDLEYDENAVLAEGHILGELFPRYTKMVYTYDMGDNWKHEIRLVRTIEGHGVESPFLLEASGQSPPEDVGGVGGFVNFRNILLDPSHPEHAAMKEWARYWTLELSDELSWPRVVHLWY